MLTYGQRGSCRGDFKCQKNIIIVSIFYYIRVLDHRNNGIEKNIKNIQQVN